MMDIRVVRVAMRRQRMSVPMSMRFAWRIGPRVLVLMVLVMVVEMLVLQRLMNMQVFVSLKDV